MLKKLSRRKQVTKDGEFISFLLNIVGLENNQKEMKLNHLKFITK